MILFHFRYFLLIEFRLFRHSLVLIKRQVDTIYFETRLILLKFYRKQYFRGLIMNLKNTMRESEDRDIKKSKSTERFLHRYLYYFYVSFCQCSEKLFYKMRHF